MGRVDRMVDVTLEEKRGYQATATHREVAECVRPRAENVATSLRGRHSIMIRGLEPRGQD